MATFDSLAPQVTKRLAGDLGLTPQQAAGIVGQLAYESDGLQAINEYNPVVPGSRGGFGWAQWTGPRRREFESWAQQNQMDVSTPEANYGFLLHELQNTPEGRVLDDIRNAQDAQTAGRIFTDRFLRPGIPAHDKRATWTDKVMDMVFPAAHAGTVSQDFQAKIQAARDAGYSDDEIMGHVSQMPDFSAKLQQAREAGYSDDEIFGHLGLSGAPNQQATGDPMPLNQTNIHDQTVEQPQEGRSFVGEIGRQLGLTARAGLEGVSALPEMLINPISQALGGPEMRISNTLDAAGFPQPENATERVAQDVARTMAGAGGIAGGANLAARGLTGAGQAVAAQMGSAIPQQIAGAAGAGAGGGVAREAGFGPGVQTAAALGGGLLASSAANRLIAPPRAKGVSDATSELQKRASNLYEQANRRGVTAQPAQTSQLQADIKRLAADEGLITPSGALAEGYPKLNGVLRMIDEYAGQPMTGKQLQSVRRLLSSAAGSSDRAESRIGTMMIRAFDDFTAPLAPELAEARNLYASAMRSQQLETLRDLAESRASQFSGSGPENALRTEYRKLNNRIISGKERGFSPEQAEAIRKVAEGTKAANLARGLGKLAPTGVVSAGLGGGVPFMIGNAIGGPVVGSLAGATSLGLGALSRQAAKALTSRNAAIAEALARNMPLTTSVTPSVSPHMGALYGTVLQNMR